MHSGASLGPKFHSNHNGDRGHRNTAVPSAKEYTSYKRETTIPSNNDVMYKKTEKNESPLKLHNTQACRIPGASV